MKSKVIDAVIGMISTAKKGDAQLFYYCCHGANDAARSQLAIKMLKSSLTVPNVIYCNELDKIVQSRPEGIGITWLTHACFSGTMFSYHPERMKGVALTSVGPNIPTAERREPDIEDFHLLHQRLSDKEVFREKTYLHRSIGSYPKVGVLLKGMRSFITVQE